MCAGFVPVLQHKGTESNQERMLQTVVFIGPSGWELVAVALAFALITQWSGDGKVAVKPLFED